ARSAASLQVVADSSVELRDLNGDGHAFSSSAADGNLELAVTGNLNVSSKVLAAGNIVLTSTGNTAINAEIDPETVTISANDDIVITSQIVATKLVTIAAGSDGTGSLQTTGTSSIKAFGSANSGDIALSAGSNSGNMLLNGTISAADSLTANAAAGSINGSAELTAKTLKLNAAAGIGNIQPIRIRVESVAADTISGNVWLQSNSPVTYTSLSTGNGDVVVNNTR
ncbi:MAG: hypothetical protein ACKPJJ_14265, partial [Planctomycetaceae bacterium]